jgi:hypothetical protein
MCFTKPDISRLNPFNYTWVPSAPSRPVARAAQEFNPERTVRMSEPTTSEMRGVRAEDRLDLADPKWPWSHPSAPRPWDK